MSHAALFALLSGLVVGLSIIVVVGAQNAFLLRQGLRGEHIGTVVLLSILSDVVLIAVGVEIAGAAQARWPWLTELFRFGGAAFLAGYGALSARRAMHPAALEAAVASDKPTLAGTLVTWFALTWFNPHVYIDTVVLLGSLANSQHAYRWWFAGGAMAASTVWFLGLGYGSKLLRPLFARAAAWRILDATIAAMVTAVAVTLAVK